MDTTELDRAALEQLRRYDTATICNGLEVLRPGYRSAGFTRRPLVAARRELPPIVGRARVGTIRASKPASGKTVARTDWYEYVATSDLPTVVVIQDLDDEPGTGAFWGEVHSAVHKALGSEGCVTNGSFRDVDALAKGFQILGGHVGPSHAHVHLVGFGEPVEVVGMRVAHDDLIHADYQGAVVVPADCVARLPEAIDLVARRERVILDIAADPAFSVTKLKDALRRAGEIH
jgi:regulator of RNase E activity RraA